MSRFIFSHVGRAFWGAVTNITHHKRQQSIASAEAYNVGKPPEKRRRVPHRRAVDKLADESSDTASSTDDDWDGCYIRSDKIVPHSFCHFPDQVIMGGTHLFHDTSLAEASHKVNLGRAGSRSRTYHDVNRTAAGMLNYLHEDKLLREICEQAKIDVDSGLPQHIFHNIPDVSHNISSTIYLTAPTTHLPQYT